jgi:hypothetical protein
MSKTEEEWERLWRDKTTKPYTPIYIERHSYWAGYYDVYYRTYTKAMTRLVGAKDELDAYRVALTELANCKKASDRAYKKKEQTK